MNTSLSLMCPSCPCLFACPEYLVFLLGLARVRPVCVRLGAAAARLAGDAERAARGGFDEKTGAPERCEAAGGHR